MFYVPVVHESHANMKIEATAWSYYAKRWLGCSAILSSTNKKLKRYLTAHIKQTAVKSTRKIGDILETCKNPVRSSKRQGAVYSITYIDCSLQYVGETKKSLFTRKKEHASSVNIMPNTVPWRSTPSVPNIPLISLEIKNLCVRDWRYDVIFLSPL